MTAFRKSILQLFIFLFTPAVFSIPVLQFDGNDQLTGALGVNVNGTLYDVTFMDGVFGDIFQDASGNLLLDATNQLDAIPFAQALLDQVLVGELDTDLFRVRGCEAGQTCWIATPYRLAEDDGGVLRAFTVSAANYIDESLDMPRSGGGEDWRDFTLVTDATWADWKLSSVPEPTTLVLLGLGLFGLGINRRK